MRRTPLGIIAALCAFVAPTAVSAQSLPDDIVAVLTEFHQALHRGDDAVLDHLLVDDFHGLLDGDEFGKAGFIQHFHHDPDAEVALPEGFEFRDPVVTYAGDVVIVSYTYVFWFPGQTPPSREGRIDANDLLVPVAFRLAQASASGADSAGNNNVGNFNAGDGNIGIGNAGDVNNGVFNAGNQNTGFFNTGDLNVQITTVVRSGTILYSSLLSKRADD
jgi:hypothetical protein